MLVVPFSHDQPDNAARVERLGVARVITRGGYTAGRVARELRVLLDEPGYAARAQAAGELVRAEDGVTAACGAIEAVMSAHTRAVGSP